MARPQRTEPKSPPPGLEARQRAAEILYAVLQQKRPLDEQLENNDLHRLESRDRALVRTIVATALRRLGTLRKLIGDRLKSGLPPSAPAVESILLAGATQILFLDVPDHAAVDLAVRSARSDRHAAHFAPLINAVLRAVARDGKAQLESLDTVILDTPEWLFQRWTAAYGPQIARDIAESHRSEPALDLTVKNDPSRWAETMQGRVLPTGTVRAVASGPVPQLPGYEQGEWWVQDAAATLPARLFGDVRGKTIADLCAAPGGKTAQLANAGATVTAVDRSEPRLGRLRENLDRLGLFATVVTADATQWSGGPFDGVLLDAPCSSTGTIRRHPDIPWLKSENDIRKLSALQARLLDRAVTLLKSGGVLVYCTCSLEFEEGEQQIEALLERCNAVVRRPIDALELPGTSSFLTPAGDLRTLPTHWPDPIARQGGLDGFYAARLVKA